MTELSDSESTAGARLLIVARRYDQDWQEGGARRKRDYCTDSTRRGPVFGRATV